MATEIRKISVTGQCQPTGGLGVPCSVLFIVLRAIVEAPFRCEFDVVNELDIRAFVDVMGMTTFHVMNQEAKRAAAIDRQRLSLEFEH